MRTIDVRAGWHNAEIAALMYQHVLRTREPCTAKVNDVRLVMFYESHKLEDHVHRPRWGDRPEIVRL